MNLINIEKIKFIWVCTYHRNNYGEELVSVLAIFSDLGIAVEKIGVDGWIKINDNCYRWLVQEKEFWYELNRYELNEF